MNINPIIFKAYDIRGIVDIDLTPEVVECLGRVIGSESIDQGERHVVVARDGRLSGLALVEALKKGLVDSGCHVVDIGMAPTPVLYYATHRHGGCEVCPEPPCDCCQWRRGRAR